MWDELDQYRPLPRCTCRIACVCLALQNAKVFRVEDKVIQLLVGLNEEFQYVSSQILLMEPFPQINRVFSMVLEQERHLEPAGKVEIDEESSNVVNAVDAGRNFGRGKGLMNNQG